MTDTIKIKDKNGKEYEIRKEHIVYTSMEQHPITGEMYFNIGLIGQLKIEVTFGEYERVRKELKIEDEKQIHNNKHTYNISILTMCNSYVYK